MLNADAANKMCCVFLLKDKTDTKFPFFLLKYDVPFCHTNVIDSRDLNPIQSLWDELKL